MLTIWCHQCSLIKLSSDSDTYPWELRGRGSSQKSLYTCVDLLLFLFLYIERGANPENLLLLLRQGLAVSLAGLKFPLKTRMTLRSQRAAYFCIPNTRIKGVHDHTQLVYLHSYTWDPVLYTCGHMQEKGHMRMACSRKTAVQHSQTKDGWVGGWWGVSLIKFPISHGSILVPRAVEIYRKNLHKRVIGSNCVSRSVAKWTEAKKKKGTHSLKSLVRFNP